MCSLYDLLRCTTTYILHWKYPCSLHFSQCVRVYISVYGRCARVHDYTLEAVGDRPYTLLQSEIMERMESVFPCTTDDTYMNSTLNDKVLLSVSQQEICVSFGYHYGNITWKRHFIIIENFTTEERPLA